MRQHRDNAIGEIDAVPALCSLAVEGTARTHIIADIRYRDYSFESISVFWIIIWSSPYRIVKIARIAWIDGNYRQMPQVFAFIGCDGQFADVQRLSLDFFRDFKRDAEFVDGNQAETARREWVAQYIGYPRLFLACPPAKLCQNQIARLRLSDLKQRNIKTRLLVGGLQPETAIITFLDHAQYLFAGLGEFLHRMGKPPLPRFLRPRQYPVTDAQRAFSTPLDDTQLRQWYPIRFPTFRNGYQLVAIDIDNFQHGDARNTAHLVECAARGCIDQPFVGHILEQRFQSDLVASEKPESARNFALACWFFRRLDKFEDLLATG